MGSHFIDTTTILSTTVMTSFWGPRLCPTLVPAGSPTLRQLVARKGKETTFKMIPHDCLWNLEWCFLKS